MDGTFIPKGSRLWFAGGSVLKSTLPRPLPSNRIQSEGCNNWTGSNCALLLKRSDPKKISFRSEALESASGGGGVQDGLVVGMYTG